jgi:hypothetical protein
MIGHIGFVHLRNKQGLATFPRFRARALAFSREGLGKPGLLR